MMFLRYGDGVTTPGRIGSRAKMTGTGLDFVAVALFGQKMQLFETVNMHTGVRTIRF